MTLSPLSPRPDRVAPDTSLRLRAWVKAVLDLPEDTAVSVTQIACPDSGCAPVETVLTVLQPGAPYSRSVPLPAAQVCASDVLRAFDTRGPA